MYCVELNTRKARLFKKSRDVNRPITGRSRNPVHSVGSRSPRREGATFVRYASGPERERGRGHVRTAQEARDILELWDAVARVAAVLNQQREDVLVLAARVRREQLREPVKHGAPIETKSRAAPLLADAPTPQRTSAGRKSTVARMAPMPPTSAPGLVLLLGVLDRGQREATVAMHRVNERHRVPSISDNVRKRRQGRGRDRYPPFPSPGAAKTHWR